MTTTYHVADIRNVALAGHGASGKTTLADALLFTSGAVNRRGSVDDGTSSLDVDEEEKRRHFTIDCHLGHLAWAGKQVHLIDTPGYPDFIGSALSALAAVENVVVAV
jgi:elongation factor G